MEWDGAESCISSTSESDCGNCAADADDEQSDWVGYAPSVTEGDFRRARRLQRKQQMSQIQRRLERFALEGGRGEMNIEFRIKDRPNSVQVMWFYVVLNYAWCIRIPFSTSAIVSFPSEICYDSS
ncbi:unnamed protein product [Angiostrongylus costaricensis]|uniref:Uncharacterized protein n=1 Tax=Angiostrongylus costaricensis TaxID=334426 RepID=A0A158PFY7_ANGCS|nr:unnamed protein product [Angiostrongylus costaricensis]